MSERMKIDYTSDEMEMDDNEKLTDEEEDLVKEDVEVKYAVLSIDQKVFPIQLSG